MGCEFQILCAAKMQQALATTVHEGFQLLEDLEQQMSIYRPHSELSQINQTAGTRPVQVDRQLLSLIGRALELSIQTNGAFDITSTPLTRLWNFHRRDGQMPHRQQITRTLESIGSRHVRLAQTSGTIQFDHAGLELDLGAIGKGYSLDRLADLLTGAGVSDFLIHGGQSSIVARGQRDGGRLCGSIPWIIGISHPLVPSHRLAELAVNDQAAGTSGCGRQSFVHRGRRYGHVIDPRTGWPADHNLSVTVVADRASDADALATALLVMDDDSLDSFCRQRTDLGVIALGPAGADQGPLTARVFNVDPTRITWIDRAVQVITHTSADEQGP